MANRPANFYLLRELLREVRLTQSKSKLKDLPQVSYIFEEFRRYMTTTEKVCYGKDEKEHAAKTYLCLLRSTRKHQEIIDSYRGSGEKSIEDSARLVGLELPQTPSK